MRTSPLIALAIVVVTLAWIGSGQLTSDAAEEATPPPPALREDADQGEVVAVRVTESEARDQTRSLVVLGRTQANRTVDLRAETDGRVTEISMDKGREVRAGDILLRLDMADRDARLEEARSLLEQRQLQHDASEKLQRRDFTSRVSLAEARANLGAAKALVAARELDMERTWIPAPFEGILHDTTVEVGDYVQAGDVVATVVDLDPLIVLGHVAEQDVGGIRLGQEGSVRLVDGRELTGKVSFLAAIADASTRTFPLELEVPNPGGVLPQGLTGELSLPLAPVRAHLVSPAVLALDGEGRVGVKYLSEDNHVAFAPVRIAGGGAEGFWVSGLPDRVSIITVGQAFVSEGQLVKPVHEEDISARSRELVERAKGAASAEGAGQ